MGGGNPAGFATSDFASEDTFRSSERKRRRTGVDDYNTVHIESDNDEKHTDDSIRPSPQGFSSASSSAFQSGSSSSNAFRSPPQQQGGMSSANTPGGSPNANTQQLSSAVAEEKVAVLEASIADIVRNIDQQSARLARLENGQDPDRPDETKASDDANQARARTWRECLLKIVLATLHSTAEGGQWVLRNMVQQDIIEYSRPPTATDMSMAIDLENRKKFVLWAYGLLHNENEMQSKRREVNMTVYSKFLNEQSNVGKSRFFFIRPEMTDDPLKEAMQHIQSQSGLALQEPAPVFPAVKASAKASAKKQAEAEDDDEEEARPTPKKSKKVLAAQPEGDVAEPTENSVLVAMNRVSEQLSQLVRDSRMDRNTRDARPRNSFGEYRNSFGDSRRFERRDDGKHPERQERDRREAYQRRPNGGRDYDRRSGDNNGVCTFFPCIKPDCKMAHRPDQFKPDPTSFSRKADFRKANRCLAFHDKGTCTNCRNTHGKVTSEGARANAPLCQHVGKGMCEEFYSASGCSKAHRQ